MFSMRTTTALLHGLGEPGNSSAWEELDGRCRPIMLAVCRRMGLTHAEAEDAVQAAMVSFVEAYRQGKYDRERGRLSAFIITILRHRAIDRVRQARQRREANECAAGLEAMSEHEVERFWLDERQNQILREALAQLREGGTDERMIAAFELYGLRGVEIDEVIAQLGMSREEVYNAKYRVTKRLQPIVARLDELYEDV
ncbi:MAG: sigma-70 family RNA polymerase sigma factor [Phycisphaeraceae bacterium]|nr:sigma-70 family RNA polymerase sigma factor [Phycisphaeraceae bacterium]MBX3365842.1 sigma-70 family RNA polymerase sigma factor [Phycisphaeraceae bacterium]